MQFQVESPKPYRTISKNTRMMQTNLQRFKFGAMQAYLSGSYIKCMWCETLANIAYINQVEVKAQLQYLSKKDCLKHRHCYKIKHEKDSAHNLNLENIIAARNTVLIWHDLLASLFSFLRKKLKLAVKESYP